MTYSKAVLSLILTGALASCGGHVDLGGTADDTGLGTGGGSSNAGGGNDPFGGTNDQGGHTGPTGQGGFTSPSGSGGAASMSGIAMSGSGGMLGAGGRASIVDAQAAPPRLGQRVVFFYTPHGTILDAWRPSADQKLGQILAPLAMFQPQLLILEGIDNVSAPSTPASTHESGPSVLLTAHLGAALGDSGGVAFSGGGPSLDVQIGRGIPATRFGSIGLGVRSPLLSDRPLEISFAGAGEPIMPRIDPSAAFSQLFPQGGPMPPSGLATIDPQSDASAPDIGRAQMDILVDALRSDLMRSATLCFFDASSSARFTWLGINTPYVDVAHASGAGSSRQDFIKIQTWFATEFAYLLSLLLSTPEGAGTMLDSTLVVWLSETGEASTDSGQSIPVVMAGTLGGHFITGQYRKLVGRTQADLLTTIALQSGVPVFGDPALGGKLLTEILAPH